LWIASRLPSRSVTVKLQGSVRQLAMCSPQISNVAVV
jgi:hypothetical protein